MSRGMVRILVLVAVAAAVVGPGPGGGIAHALLIDNNPSSPGYGYYIPDYFATANWANSPPIRKFVDNVAGLGAAGANNLGQYIPVAVADNTTYPGSDYYEIAVVQYREQLHSDLPPVVGAKANPASTGGTPLRGYVQEVNGVPMADPHYLGPLIIAQKDRPIRIKFINRLPAGAGGALFIPVDTTVMGSGPFEINYDPVTKAPTGTVTGSFLQNRATLHLHGGHSPWISDGTPHQWITPAADNASAYPRGVSVAYVPDMWFDAAGNTIAACAGKTACLQPGATNDPGPGAQTFFWTNQQSGRLMFYHDHAWGITRLNVYVGEAAGYLIQDNVELALVNGGTVNGRTYSAGTIPAAQIPLVIQDKTFVDNNPLSPTYIGTTDPTWAWGSAPGKPGAAAYVAGDLWWPHVYMPAQNPYNPDMTGMNPFGRWHYGPWFFPPTPVCGSTPAAVKPLCVETGPVANVYYDNTCVPSAANGFFCQPPQMPGTPNPSWGAEAFLDTMMVNGTVYPVLNVDPKSYRLRILNAAHDRFLNLQLYKASNIIDNVILTSGGSGYTSAPVVTFVGGGGSGATATATVDLTTGSPTYGQVTAIRIATVGSGYTTPPGVLITGGGATLNATASATIHTAPTEVGMVPATLTAGFPAGWPTDGREGGVPDPATAGPRFIQIGTEGGFLPQPVILPNQPVAWNLDPTMFNVGNVLQQNQGGGTLFLGPAERADVIVDFSAYAGQTLILYNDAPTAFPALVPQYDYYTNNPDRRDIGGHPGTRPGFGPNIRTVMQIKVSNTAPAAAFNLAALQGAFAPSGPTPGVFPQAQEPIVVGQSAYDTTYNMVFPATWPYWGVSRISDTSLSFQRVDGTFAANFPMERKAIHDEMGASFDDYGRMSAKLGLEVPGVNAAIQTFILQNYVDPATEIVNDNQVQIWRITHNGVDTHPIHFHLFDVQLINRVGWDGFIRLPDPNELGWKDTIRISPLEDTIVALRPTVPKVPFALPVSVRPLNPMRPLGDMMGFSQIDTVTGGPLAMPTTNEMTNFGFEYVWHCHILSHEENDMMRSVVLVPPPRRPGTDFDGDGKADIGIFRPSASMWYVKLSGDGSVMGQRWGDNTDIVVPGDYDGDGKADVAVFRPATATWYILQSSNGAVRAERWGDPTDTPVPGDYDGDGTTDLAVWRSSPSATWYIKQSSTGAVKVEQWGDPTDVPVPGDYDGDRKADIAVWRPSTGDWWIRRSSDTTTARVTLGLSTDTPAPGDYDGDGATDAAVFRSSTPAMWYILESSTGATVPAQWGDPTDTPVPGDYDGDGKTDLAVWRSTTTIWYIKQSSNGAVRVEQWGDPTDTALKTLY